MAWKISQRSIMLRVPPLAAIEDASQRTGMQDCAIVIFNGILHTMYLIIVVVRLTKGKILILLALEA